MIKRLIGLFDQLSMYRLLVAYLGVLLALAFVLGFFGLVPAEPTALAFSLVLVLAASEVAHRGFAAIFAVPSNRESTLITALIIVLLMKPVTAADLPGVGGLVAAAVFAVASKYLIRLRGRHVFNPAAFGVMLVGLVLNQPAAWWVTASPWMLPVVVVGGALVVYKVRRIATVIAAIVAYVAVALVLAPQGSNYAMLLLGLAQTSIFFLSFAMLTEPLTAPAGRWRGVLFGLVVGGLAVPGLAIGPIALKPEIALCVGNLLGLALTRRDRMTATLKWVEEAGNTALDMVFAPSRPLKFRPGQYLEWTLGLRDGDERGNRRQFTIASAPDEGDLRIGVRISPEPSAFKRALRALQPGDSVQVGQLGGDFTLPFSKKRKLAFLAGGVGITPFRSMVQHMVLRGEARPVVLFYGCGKVAEFAYRDIFAKAEAAIGLKTVYVAQFGEALPEGVVSGLIDESLLRRELPDFSERLFYVSGPPAMVRAMRQTLRQMGVPRRRIRTDAFRGLSA